MHQKSFTLCHEVYTAALKPVSHLLFILMHCIANSVMYGLILLLTYSINFILFLRLFHGMVRVSEIIKHFNVTKTSNIFRLKCMKSNSDSEFLWYFKGNFSVNFTRNVSLLSTQFYISQQKWNQIMLRFIT